MASQIHLKGFTLAELLIALAILGVIATFTIPKVLQAQQANAWNAITKESMATVASAYQMYKMKNTVTANFHASDMYPYLNYVAEGSMEPTDIGGGVCWPVGCVKLHNGAMISTYNGTTGTSNGDTFGGTTSQNYVYISFDPDGKVTAPTNNFDFILYYDGRVRPWADCIAGDVTYENGSVLNYCPNGWSYPSWFKW